MSTEGEYHADLLKYLPGILLAISRRDDGGMADAEILTNELVDAAKSTEDALTTSLYFATAALEDLCRRTGVDLATYLTVWAAGMQGEIGDSVRNSVDGRRTSI